MKLVFAFFLICGILSIIFPHEKTEWELKQLEWEREMELDSEYQQHLHDMYEDVETRPYH